MHTYIAEPTGLARLSAAINSERARKKYMITQSRCNRLRIKEAPIWRLPVSLPTTTYMPITAENYDVKGIHFNLTAYKVH